MAEAKGYGRIKQELVARQFVNVYRQTLRRYMEEGMPTTPKRVANMQERIIIPTLKHDFETRPTILMEVLRRFADEYPRHTEKIEQIIQKIIGRSETEENEEQTTEPQTQNSQQQ